MPPDNEIALENGVTSETNEGDRASSSEGTMEEENAEAGDGSVPLLSRGTTTTPRRRSRSPEREIFTPSAVQDNSGTVYRVYSASGTAYITVGPSSRVFPGLTGIRRATQ